MHSGFAKKETTITIKITIIIKITFYNIPLFCRWSYGIVMWEVFTIGMQIIMERALRLLDNAKRSSY